MSATYYRITEETLIQWADEMRRITGKTGTLKPAQMISLLKGITADGGTSASGTALSFGSTAIGILPEVFKGYANSTLNLNAIVFNVNAIGEINNDS